MACEPENVPQISPRGVAQQTTLMARLAAESKDRAEIQMRINEIKCWIEFAGRRHWPLVVRHGMTQLRMAESELELLDL